MMKHFTIVFIYGLLALLSHNGVDMGNVDFQTFSILLSWLMLILIIFTMKWFDKVTDGYFIFTILFAIAARLARYNAPSVADDATMISMLVTGGLLVQSIHKKQMGTGMLVLGILMLEWVTLSGLMTESVDLSGLFT